MTTYETIAYETIIVETRGRVGWITLNRPEAPFLANIAMPFASIVSKEYADTLEAAGAQQDLNNLPIGTGPFRFVAYQKDAVIRYQKNADYWGEQGQVQEIVFRTIDDPTARRQALEAGDIDGFDYVAPADTATTTTSVPTSSIAPATCTNSGRFHASGRTIASITRPASRS